ncbi:MAG: GNAT family N-acetyltransferase [Rhodothermales bacterium]|nr:GNAT family N-acetyltransferase [Rhodothermales bacterium]MBO6779500.1 GNAT family N-acetyltransferase [Rhodothermales bacterium]
MSLAPDGLVIEGIGRDRLDEIDALNREIFGEKRIINSFDKEDLTMLLARVHAEPVGFKLGYRQNRMTFYSAKGGVRQSWRRQGVAEALLDALMDEARGAGYRKFAFDTFPNMHPGMTMMALKRGFRLTEADFNRTYQDFRLRFEASL